jgi:translation initiation factor IF-2
LSKLRVYELARDYGMKGPEMVELLHQLGFEQIKGHMTYLSEADQMMVMARLEASGLRRRAAGADAAEAGSETRGAALPKKKSLPPPIPAPVREPVKKKLPDGTETEAVELEPEPAPAPRKRLPTPPVEPAPQPIAAERAPVVEAAPPPPAPAPLPPAPAPAVPPPPAPRIEEPVVAERHPAAEPPPQPPPAGGAEAPSDDVKRLLVPQPKAKILRRIELAPETIRDATRRSAPSSERNPAGVDRNLRRMALQNAQSRPGTLRSPLGGPQRRGPGGASARGRGPGSRRPGGSRDRGMAATVDPNKIVELTPPVSIKALSEALGIKVNELIATLTFKLGVKGKTINSFLTPEEVELVALEANRNIKIVERREAEEELLQDIVEQTAEATDFLRAPVVTFMGHVDHGKTSLLDALRRSDVVAKEAGGITQHIGAYRVQSPTGHELVVLDTPGHAAFTAMRARGAGITDVVVLVVAADDGVMPQTEEAISHARDAKVPIVVAVNKCDKPGANPMQVRQQLAIKGLQPEEWGGTTQFAEVSALTGQGLDTLVEKIMLEAELLDLKAKPDAPATGVVVESRQSPEQGIVVNVLVTNGTLRLRERVLCGNSFARVRGMMDDHGRMVEEAGPSTPVAILGMDTLPQPGEKFYAVTDAKKAREVVEERQRRARDLSLAERTVNTITLENLSEALAAQKIQELKIILKADVTGSLEPIRRSLEELSSNEVRVNIIHTALGGITEADVALAEAGKAVIIGFNTVPDQAARQAAERAGVDIRFYDVIYHLIDDMKLAIEGLLAPDEVEKVLGHAEVRAVFKSSRFGNIAGCYVLDGVVTRGAKVRVSRDKKLVHTGSIATLKRVKDDVREVRAGFECGMTIEGWNDVREGDQLEFYEMQLVKRTLS